MKNVKQNIIASIFTIAIVAMLIVAGPASAIDIKVDSLKGHYNKDKQIQFTVDTRINHGGVKGELLTNLQYTEIKFTKDGSEWSETCKVYLNNTVEGCNFLYVKDIKASGDYGRGYGYGYNDDEKQNLGYGYGYGYNNSQSHIKYKLMINSSLLGEGTYYAATNVYAGSPAISTFSSEDATKFIIFKAKGKEKKEKHDEEEFDDDAGFDVEIDKAGNITVEEYGNDHPVSKLKGPSDKRLLGSYLDISTDAENFTNATIKIYYKGNGKNLGIYYFNETSEQWDFVGNVAGEDSKKGKYISANTTHFSLYALFGDEPVEVKTAPANGGGYGSEYIAPAKPVEKKLEPGVKNNTDEIKPETIAAGGATVKEETRQKEEPKTVKSESNMPTGRFLTATNASMAAAIFVLLSGGGLILRKKGII